MWAVSTQCHVTVINHNIQIFLLDILELFMNKLQAADTASDLVPDLDDQTVSKMFYSVWKKNDWPAVVLDFVIIDLMDC